jgi:hypothetical protein
VARHQTRKVDGFAANRHSGEDLIWGAAATAGALSMMHVDDVGLAASITVMSGSKWWVVCRRRQELPDMDRRGDIFSTHSFPKDWAYGSTGEPFLEAEGLHLKAGDVL